MAGNTVTRNMAGSQRLVFFGGLIMAIISAIMVFMIANGAGDSGGAAKVPVVTANDTIPAQTRITAEMLKIVYLEQGAAAEDVYTSRSQAVGHVTVKEVPPGAQLVPSMLTTTSGEGLTFVVSPGMRAVSINVEEVVTAGGNLKPGDRVDIIGVFEISGKTDPNALLSVLAPGQNVGVPPSFESDDNAVLIVTLLQDVKVLGLAQTLAPEPDSAGASAEEPDAQPGASTATLELSPQQSQIMTLADEYGIIRFSARPAGDSEITPVAPTLVEINRSQ